MNIHMQDKGQLLCTKRITTNLGLMLMECGLKTRP